MKESIRSLNDISSTTDKAEIISNQFESVFSMDDGNEPIYLKTGQNICVSKKVSLVDVIYWRD